MKKFFALSIAAILFTACQMKGSNSNETTQQQTSERSDSPAEGTAVGCKYIDFSLPGIQGNDIAVSDYVSKNRYTLVDFWLPGARRAAPRCLLSSKPTPPTTQKASRS